MGQSSGANHQRHGDGEHVDGALAALGVGGKTQLGQGLVKLVEHGQTGAVCDFRAQSNLRNRYAGNQHGNENGGHQIGKDQHTVLGHLGVGNALHATQYGVHKDDGHTNNDAPENWDVEELGEDDADAAHLSRDVGKRNQDQTDHCDHASRGGIIPSTDEIRHGELTEFAQIGGE